MKKMVLMIFFLLITNALIGCSYNAKVSSTSAPVAEIRPDKQIECNATYIIDNEISDLTKNVKPSTYMCSAHSYPIEVGDAIKSSIIKVLDGTFNTVTSSTSRSHSDEDGKYKFIFSLDSFQPSLRFSPGFWQASISANSELIMKVTVLDSNGNEVVRTTFSGEGSAESGGQCGDGADVVAQATEKAIKRALENFVYKIINSDYLALNEVIEIEVTMK